jgi:N-acetylglucosaminyl-diphospho-decaprenol L-rhamnosyltransferase
VNPVPSSPPDLSIIIVNWNVKELLRDCLASIADSQGSLALEVIVVDSASSDGSVAMVRHEFPWVVVIACTENVGFPRGNNLGIAKANGRYILLLNPDTRLLNDALATMVAYLQQQPDVGVVGAQLLNGDGTIQSSRRRFPTLATAFFESTWLEKMAPPGLLRRYYALDLPDDAIADVDWVTGACMMAPRAVATAVGGLDEGYFMYSEELDWCRRIKAAGWRVIYLPTAQIVHYVGKSSEQAIVARHINFQQAKLRYFQKYHSRLAAILLRLFLLLSYGWQLLLEGMKGLIGHKRPLRWQRVRAYWAVIRSGLRPAGY